jgi:hypothetical protein
MGQLGFFNLVKNAVLFEGKFKYPIYYMKSVSQAVDLKGFFGGSLQTGLKWRPFS